MTIVIGPTLNSLDNFNDVTIGKVLNTYGVSESHVGFILDASYTFLLAIVLLVCMCYR